MTVAERRAEAARLRAEGLLWREVADRLGVAIPTAHAYVADPDGSKSAARKRSYAAACERCGGATDGSNGRAKPVRVCQACRSRSGAPVDERRAMSRARRGGLPQSRTITLGEFAAGVRETADRLGSGSLSRLAYDRHRADGLLSVSAVADRWRWNEIIEAAGLVPTAARRDRADYHPVDAETALEAARDCQAEMGRFPSSYLYDAWARRESRVTRMTVLRALGVPSWMDVEELL